MRLLLPLLCACAGPAADTAACTPDEAALGLGWGSWAQGFFTGYCAPCHGEVPAYGAPEDLRLDTEDEVRRWEDRVRERVLQTQTMPPAGGVTEEDRALLEAWLDCG